MKTYPRYFVGRLWSERDAYLRFDSQYSCVWVKNDGKESPQAPGSELDADRPDGTWDEVTFDVAQARLLPEARPLRWVENCKPDKPGLWVRRGADGEIASVYAVADPKASHHEWSLATHCYLGPIPEILPPKRKVVQRLWVMKLGTSGWPATYDEQWVDDTHPDPEDGKWIRTDETREVEQAEKLREEKQT